ncbi:MAG: DUF2235 domain-containing protein [Anaerolineales bacterium]|uniref:DUF2235 domain-containing protein n=1 Tax=Candidatus Desulfolinea nitratireducens TaxID=2841698 RepID=A0A8J6NK22_9CHLR|nr:DUF2235 domain-containing protein [Candidatus Desulfolinea nitratireducens]MBL6959564.1 DUF2235 domain-containing protein [Anaerolineales bacterium]
MPKNIVILSDGTGQEGGRGHDTNVYKLFRMLEDRTDQQVVFYDEGLGTDWRKISGNIAGAGMRKNILQCYQFIYENYNAGDKIFLFGFSRGAATVRSLANFIDYFGILPKSRPELIKKAYALYRIGREEKIIEKVEEAPENQNLMDFATQGIQNLRDLGDIFMRGRSLNTKAEKFIHQHPNQWASIEFLGVWDTVPALGLPGAVIDTFVNIIPGWRHRYHDFTLHSSVRNAYHALSIDDDRKWFHPTIWDWYDKKYQKVEQVWFSGSHTDVGGGFDESGLSDISLEWMVQKAVSHGIRLFLRSSKYWNFCVAPDPTDQIHLPREGGGKIYPGKQRYWPKGVEKTFGIPKVHESVFERVKRVEGYQPWILQKFSKTQKESSNKIFEYEGEKASIRDYDESSWQEQFEIEGDEIKTTRPENDYDNLIERGEWGSNRLRRDLTRWKNKG